MAGLFLMMNLAGVFISPLVSLTVSIVKFMQLVATRWYMYGMVWIMVSGVI